MKRIISGLFFVSLLLSGSTLFAEPHAYPVPFVASRDQVITFVELGGRDSIKIYTVDGAEVINIGLADSDITKEWAAVNASGKKVATGLYIYVIEGDGKKTTGKLVVIR